MSIDERIGLLVLTLFESKNAMSSAISRLFKGLPVKIERTSGKSTRIANIRGAETITLEETSLSDRVPLCTSGFNVKNNATGKLYATTAAHCVENLKVGKDIIPPAEIKLTLNDRKSTVDDKITLTTFKKFHTASQDFMVMSVPSPHKVLPEFFIAADKKAIGLTGKRLLSSTKARSGTVMGDIVCHYGMTTGRSCGEVKSKIFAPPSCGATGELDCAATWVLVQGNKLDCWGGDSGGPVYIGSVAVGLVSHAFTEWTNLKTNKPYTVWDTKTMKGKGGCGGEEKGGNTFGWLAYMSTDEFSKAKYTLMTK